VGVGQRFAKGRGARVEDLSKRLQRWVEAGLLEASQGEAIRRFEEEAAVATAPPSRLPLIAEVLGYAGGLLVLVAVGQLVFDRLWSALPTWGQVGMLAALSLIAVGLGAWLRRGSSPSARRLARLCWLLSLPAAVGSIYVAATAGFAVGEAGARFAASMVALVLAVGLWSWERSAPQVLGMYASAVFAGGSAAALVTPPSRGALGAALWALGAAGVVLTLLGVIVPPRISLILGSAIALAGPALADIQTAGEVWGLLTGAGLAAAGVWRRRVELLIIGALGVVGYAIALVYRLVGDDLGAATTLLLSGVILVAGALVTARLAGVSSRSTP
jgi:Predicted membrane protein (DUF2157)